MQQNKQNKQIEQGGWARWAKCTWAAGRAATPFTEARRQTIDQRAACPSSHCVQRSAPLADTGYSLGPQLSAMADRPTHARATKVRLARNAGRVLSMLALPLDIGMLFSIAAARAWRRCQGRVTRCGARRARLRTRSAAPPRHTSARNRGRSGAARVRRRRPARRRLVPLTLSGGTRLETRVRIVVSYCLYLHRERVRRACAARSRRSRAASACLRQPSPRPARNAHSARAHNAAPRGRQGQRVCAPDWAERRAPGRRACASATARPASTAAAA